MGSVSSYNAPSYCVNIGALSILYFSAHSLISKTDELCLRPAISLTMICLPFRNKMGLQDIVRVSLLRGFNIHFMTRKCTALAQPNDDMFTSSLFGFGRQVRDGSLEHGSNLSSQDKLGS